MSAELRHQLQHQYHVKPADLEPRVFWRLTDNWLELTVRLLARDHGVREIKDAMSREVLAALDAAGIGLASASFEVVGLPALRIQRQAPQR